MSVSHYLEMACTVRPWRHARVNIGAFIIIGLDW